MLKVIFKFLVAFLLCYWLFKNGKLDFSLISQAFHLGYLWIFALFLLGIRFFINALRFKVLLDLKAIPPISYLKVFSFDAIGNLFSVILPGTAAGDIIRFFYYKNLNEKLTPASLVAFISIDRIWGLVGLMALGSLISIFQYETLTALNAKLTTLILLNFLGFLVLVLLVFLLFSNNYFSKRILLFFSNFLERWPKLQNIFNDIISIKLSFATSIQCLLLSMISHICMVAGFWALILPFTPPNVSFFSFFTIIPIGMIGTSLPVAPAGLGIGHVLFENLFKLIQIDNGASLFNLYFIINVAICLLGIIPYLYVKRS